jgi:hypothetical protein
VAKAKERIAESTERMYDVNSLAVQVLWVDVKRDCRGVFLFKIQLFQIPIRPAFRAFFMWLRAGAKKGAVPCTCSEKYI